MTGEIAGVFIGLTAGSALEYLHLRRADFLYSTMVATEAWFLGVGATRLLKHSIGRCRPVAWNEELERCDPALLQVRNSSAAEEEFGDGEAYRAMPSGHVAGVAAISGAYFWLAVDSPEPSWQRWAAFGLTQSMAWATLGLRLEAGAHSLSDTLVSWGMNSFIGISVAALHDRKQLGRLEELTGIVDLRLVPHGRGIGLAGSF